MATKIAFPTDDGHTLSRHLGRAPFYQVVTLEPGQAPQFEQRAKPHHGADRDHGAAAGHAEGHGPGPAMFAPLADCQVLIAGGMGQPGYERARAQGLDVILTGERTIAEALAAYQAGKLVSDLRRVHAH